MLNAICKAAFTEKYSKKDHKRNMKKKKSKKISILLQRIETGPALQGRDIIGE